MSKQHSHSEHKHHAEHHAPKKGIHQKWWFWLAVILMLGAMGLYVVTNDESVLPDGQIQQPVPEAAE